jgi:hypothetical protein
MKLLITVWAFLFLFMAPQYSTIFLWHIHYIVRDELVFNQSPIEEYLCLAIFFLLLQIMLEWTNTGTI